MRGRSDRGQVAYASGLMEGYVGGAWIRQQVKERRVFKSEGKLGRGVRKENNMLTMTKGFRQRDGWLGEVSGFWGK